MKQTISIQKVEVRTGANGDYHLFQTNLGGIIVFDDIIAETMVKFLNKNIIADVVINGKFTNITAVYPDEVVTEEPMAALSQEQKKSDNFADAREAKNKTMYVSYAKDLMIGKALSAEDAIEAVKKLKAAF